MHGFYETTLVTTTEMRRRETRRWRSPKKLQRLWRGKLISSRGLTLIRTHMAIEGLQPPRYGYLRRKLFLVLTGSLIAVTLKWAGMGETVTQYVDESKAFDDNAVK